MTNQEIQVHKTHCCAEHGCKYGDDDCPVFTGKVKQDYKCQDCKSINIDPKYIGIPNICFSLIAADDKREAEFAEQRRIRGFDDSETYSLTGTIAKFIIPRLERFNEIDQEVTERSEEFDNKINSILEAMRLIIRGDESWDFNDEEVRKVQLGINALSDVFMNLWW